MTDVAEQLHDVVRAIISKDMDGARVAFARIDREHIEAERAAVYKTIWAPGGLASKSVPHQPGIAHHTATQRRKLEIFRRDQFTCRYMRCRRRTIYLPVLTAVAKALPDLQAHHPNWKPLSEHILFWTYGTCLEHYVPCAHGGTSEADNLITTCYQCNDLKNRLTAEDLGWARGPISTRAWDGLIDQLPALNRAISSP